MNKSRRAILKTLAATAFVPAAARAQPAAPTIKLAMIEGLSGANANGGEAVYRNLVWAVERVNQRGGVRTREGRRQLELDRYDSKGTIEEAISSLRSAIDQGARIILQATPPPSPRLIGERSGAQPARAGQARVSQILRSRSILTNEVQLLALPLRAPPTCAGRPDGAEGRHIAESVFDQPDYSFGRAVRRGRSGTGAGGRTCASRPNSPAAGIKASRPMRPDQGQR
jgi:hypothetical protein